MKSNIKIIVISLKKSKRISKLKNRLNNINVKFKILKAIDGKLYKENNKLNYIYNKEITTKNIGREMSESEIGCAASHLKAYRYILKNKIKQAIIMEDDAYPSNFISRWIKSNVQVENNKILNFYCYPYGVINKKPYKKFFNNSIKVHKVVGYTTGAACYQINNYTCQKIIRLTKNKVSGLPDWPFSILKDKIELMITLPFLAHIDDGGFSYLKKDRNNLLNENKFIKKKFFKIIIKILRIPYYLSYFPYFTSKYPNKYFYYEYYVHRIILKIKNFIFRKYLELETLYYKRDNYCKDLKKIIKFTH